MKNSLLFRGWLCYALTLLFYCSVVQAQDLPLKGRVVDKTNSPVIGATVKVDGTSKGTTTNPARRQRGHHYSQCHRIPATDPHRDRQCYRHLAGCRYQRPE